MKNIKNITLLAVFAGLASCNHAVNVSALQSLSTSNSINTKLFNNDEYKVVSKKSINLRNAKGESIYHTGTKESVVIKRNSIVKVHKFTSDNKAYVTYTHTYANGKTQQYKGYIATTLNYKTKNSSKKTISGNSLVKASALYEVTASNGINVRTQPTTLGDTLLKVNNENVKIKKGYVVDVVNINGSWAEILYNDSTAYVSTKYLKQVNTTRPSYKISKKSVSGNIEHENKDIINEVKGSYYVSTSAKGGLEVISDYKKDNTSSKAVLDYLNNDSLVEVLDIKSIEEKVDKIGANGSTFTSIRTHKYAKISYNNKIGYCKFDELSKVKSSATKEEKTGKMLEIVKEQLGKEYQLGATGIYQFDCSGFVKYVYKKGAGIDLKRNTANQAKDGNIVTTDPTYTNLQVGDLIFFDSSNIRQEGINHVGIYIGNGKYAHAPRKGDVVRIDNIGDGYYLSNFVQAVRMFN